MSHEEIIRRLARTPLVEKDYVDRPELTLLVQEAQEHVLEERWTVWTPEDILRTEG